MLSPKKMSRALRCYRPEETVTALAVSANREDLAFLSQLFRDANWTLLEAQSVAEARKIAGRHRLDLVITDRNLPDGDWRRLREAFKPFSQPLIVTSRLADDYLWAEVLNEGGYDVLAQPFDREEVTRVISAATRRSHNELRRITPPARPLTLTAGA